MKEKGISLTVIGIVAIIAAIGLVMMFTQGTTGKTWWSAGGHMQMTPETACSMHGPGCVKAEIIKGSEPYREVGGVLKVICKCPTGYKAPNDYSYPEVPLVQNL